MKSYYMFKNWKTVLWTENQNIYVLISVPIKILGFKMNFK